MILGWKFGWRVMGNPESGEICFLDSRLAMLKANSNYAVEKREILKTGRSYIVLIHTRGDIFWGYLHYRLLSRNLETTDLVSRYW